MSEKSNLQKLISECPINNLLFDPGTQEFIKAPSHIEPFIGPQGTSISQPMLSPCMKFMPSENVDQTFCTPSGLELINFQSNSLCFISEYVFTRGVHVFELIHFIEYKDIQVGILKDEAKQPKAEHVLNLEKGKLGSSVIIKLDMESKTLSALFKSIGQKSEI